MEALRAGIIGCGNISDAYLARARDFAAIEVVACADLDAGLARTQAQKYGVRALATDEMLAEDARSAARRSPPASTSIPRSRSA